MDQIGCWHEACTVPYCDGTHHANITGVPWEQAPGHVFCDDHLYCHAPEECASTVLAVFRRITRVLDL
jgi:hypothetical protein